MAAASALAIASLAAGAHADGIGVVAASASRTDRGAVAAAIAGAAGVEPGRRVVADALAQARAAVEAGAVPAEVLPRFRRVRDLVAEGWGAYLRVDFEFAQARLAVARTEAEGIVALPGGAIAYADAALRLGIVLGQLGHADDAGSAIALALALDPERPISLAEFSPDVVATVDAVRARVRPTHDVTITVEPAGAIASVDGKELGASPVRAQLAVGQHVVTARARGYRARGQLVAVEPATASVAVELERDDDWQRLAQGAVVGTGDANAQALVDSALRFGELDELVLAVDSDRRGGEALLVQRCAGLPARCTAVVEIGYAAGGLAAAAREAWQAVRAADLRYPPSVLADARAAAPAVVAHRCEWCRSPWVWGGASAVVVIGAVAAIAIATSSRPPPAVGVDPSGYVKP